MFSNNPKTVSRRRTEPKLSNGMNSIPIKLKGGYEDE